MASRTTLKAEIAALQRRVADLKWNTRLNCPRISAIEEGWAGLAHEEYALIFFDLDGLNALNDAYGYNGVNRRIAAVWDAMRLHFRATDPHGQYQGGDEYLIAVRWADAPDRVAERLQHLLRFVGLSASRAIVQAAPDLDETVARATRLLKGAGRGARGAGGRGMLAVEDRAELDSWEIVASGAEMLRAKGVLA